MLEKKKRLLFQMVDIRFWKSSLLVVVIPTHAVWEQVVKRHFPRSVDWLGINKQKQNLTARGYPSFYLKLHIAKSLCVRAGLAWFEKMGMRLYAALVCVLYAVLHLVTCVLLHLKSYSWNQLSKLWCHIRHCPFFTQLLNYTTTSQISKDSLS